MKRVQYLFMFVIALAVASCTKENPLGSEPAPTVPTESVDAAMAVPGWIRIKISEEATPLKAGVFTRGSVESGNDEIDRIAQMLGATEVRRVFSDGGKFAERRRRYGLHLWYDIRFDEDVPVSRAATEFTMIPQVEHIEPIYPIHPSDAQVVAVPREMIYTPSAALAAAEMPFNDPQLPSQWHYNNEGGAKGFVAGADINLFEAWKVETGKPEVIISVHDEGVKITHEDLAAHIWTNEAELNGTEGVDDDNNGYIDDVHGWNYLHTNPNITPDGHGTHVSGTITAINNNGIGVCGVAGGTGADDGVRVMPLQILIGKTFSNLAPETYTYAADNGAVISQNSWTLGRTGELPYSYSVAFDYFINEAGTDENGVQTGPMKGGVIIFAAGNAGGPTLLPAASDKVISVASMGPDYQKGGYSSSGPEIDILAPGGPGQLGGGGEQVLSTYVDQFTGEDSYTYLWGTSMACPHVSGVAGLIVSHFGGPGFTAAECTKRLLNAYKPMGGIIPDSELGNIGVGLLDAGAALMEDPAAAPGKIADASADAEGQKINLSWKVPADGNGAAVAKYLVESVAEGEEPVNQEITNIYNVGTEVTYSFNGKSNTQYRYSIKSQDRWGNVSDPVELTVTTIGAGNQPPVVKQSIADSNISGTGSGYSKIYSLSDYFTDPDIESGDALTYTAVSSAPETVEATVADGVLTILPKAKGSAEITVTATDKGAESVQMKFKVNVMTGGNTGGIDASLSVYPNPAEAVLYISMKDLTDTAIDVTVFDAAARKALSTSVSTNAEGVAQLNVGMLSPGAYSVHVKYAGGSLRSNFLKK